MVDAPVAGRVCHTGIRAVPHVTETVVAYDEDARTLTYQATDGLPPFVSLARNRWQVNALDANRSEVSFAAQLEVRGLRGRLAGWLLLRQVGRSGRHVLEDLKHYVEHGTPSIRKRAQLGRAGTPSGTVAAVGAWPTTQRLRAALRTNAMFCLVVFADTDERLDAMRQALAALPDGTSPAQAIHRMVERVFATPGAVFGPDRATRTALVLGRPELRAKALDRLLAAQQEFAAWLHRTYPALDAAAAATVSGALVGGLVGAALASLERGDPAERIRTELERAVALMERGLGGFEG